MLAAVLLHNEAFGDVAAVLTDASFFVPQYAAVWRAMERLVDAGDPIDPLTLEKDLRGNDDFDLVGGFDGLAALTDRYANTSRVAHHAAIVREHADVRGLVVLAAEIADAGKEAIPDVRAFIDDASARFNSLTVSASDDVGLTKISTHVHGAFEEIVERAKAKIAVTGIPTGFHDLDVMTSGMQPSDLWLLAARPAMGKTAMALNILRHVSVPKDVHPEALEACTPSIVFSAEMSIPQLIERMLCDKAKIDSQKLRVGRLIESEFRELVVAADLIHRSPIWVDDTAAPKIDDMRRKVSNLRRRGNLPKDGKILIVVDYLQLCEGSKARYGSREQEIGDISRGLKQLAKDEHGAVLALAQLTRDVDKRPDHRPQISDLRESGSLEQDADTIGFIYREERYIADEAKRREVEGKAEVIIGKQRKGPTGTVNLIFQGKHTRFTSAAAEDVYGHGM